MKIVTVTIDDPVPQQGWVIVNYSAPAGGRTSVGYMLSEGVTAETVAAGLAQNMQGRPEWPAYLKAQAKGNAVRIACPDDVDGSDGLTFTAEYNPDPLQAGPKTPAPAWIAIAEEGWGG